MIFIVFSIGLNQNVIAQNSHICELNNTLLEIDSLLNNDPGKGIKLINKKLIEIKSSYQNCEGFLLKYSEILYYINKNRFDSASLLLTEIKNFVTSSKTQHNSYITYKADLLNAYFLIRTGNFEQSINLLSSLINTNKIVNDQQNLFLANLYRVIAFQNIQLTDSAFSLVKKMETMFKPTSVSNKEYYRLLIVKAYLYRDKKEYKKSILEIEPVLSEIKRKNKLAYANVCLLLSENYFELNNFNASEFATSEGLNTLNALNSNNQKPIFYIRQSFLDTTVNDYKAAYSNLMKAYSINGIVYNDKLAVITQNNLIKFRTELKEIENKNLLKERRNFIVLLLIVSSVLILLIFLLLKLKNVKDKLEKSNSFQNKLISIISHDFRSPLFALHNLTDQVAYTVKKQNFDKLNALANGISESSLKMSNLLSNLLNLAYANKAPECEKVNLFELLDETKELYNTILQNKSIVVTNLVSHNTIINIKKNVLELIVRNWLDNTLKYSNLTYINFTVHSTELSNTIFIENDGEILSKTKESILKQIKSNGNENPETAFGLGLSLIAEYSKKEGWLLNLESNNNKTIFSIKIKK
ncbi:MAG: sensor histidine kinase [Chitinophagaceae bacterium]